MSSLGRENLEEVTRFHGHGTVLFDVALQPDNLEDETRVRDENTSRTRIRFAVAGVLLVCLLLIAIDSFTARRVESASATFFLWVEANPSLGVFAVISVYSLATVLFIPGSILTVGTGFAFGAAFDGTAKAVVLASTAVFFGASLGSIASFLLGRYLFRDCVLQMVANYPMFQAIDRALQGNGLKIMILLRLSPLIPYNALDYMCGITSIPLWAYSAALIALLPGVIMFTFIGATASSVTAGAMDASEGKAVRIFSVVFGTTFAILGVLVASYYSKLELDKILESEEAYTSKSTLRNDETTPSVERLGYGEFETRSTENLSHSFI